MKLTAVMEGDEEGAENGSRTVEDIEAIRILIKDPDENADEQVPSPMEIRIKNKLSDFYNIEQGNININVQGE
jgi:stage III sporulation protein AF